MNAIDLVCLVIEDDDFQRATVVRMLRSLGVVDVREAADGKKALDLLRATPRPAVDIALCDMDMPEMDGLELLRHMGQGKEVVSVVILSALDSALLASVKKMSLAYGIRLLGVVEKPIGRARLEAMLAQYARPETAARGPRPAVRTFTVEEILHGVHEGQFEPFFQPKLDVKTKRVVGAEALARWLHPEHGIIAPYAFIPLLEKADAMDELTFVMLKEAAKGCRCLHDKGYPVSVSVNLSLTSLTDSGLAQRITTAVRDAGLDPRHVILEVTESAAMTDVASALETLARLRMHGFGLSIDDYGTGYASLQQLTRIAFTELKIDQSFVKEFADNPSLHVIVASSIEMARKLKVKSVAEGVETQADWDALVGLGCDTAQGYLIAKPMKLASMVDFCAASAT